MHRHGVYYHHGIYMYDDYVIQLTDKGVGLKSYTAFKDGGYVYRLYYDEKLKPEIIVARAKNALYKNTEKYNLLTNNCEHFATKIATRFAQSTQAQAGIVLQHQHKLQDEYDDSYTMLLSRIDY